MLHIGLFLRNVICQYFLTNCCLGNIPGVLVSQPAELIKQHWNSVFVFCFFQSEQNRGSNTRAPPCGGRVHSTDIERGAFQLPSSRTLTALRHGRFHPSWFRLRSTAGDRTGKQQRSDLFWAHFQPLSDLRPPPPPQVTSQFCGFYTAYSPQEPTGNHTSHSHHMELHSWHFDQETTTTFKKRKEKKNCRQIIQTTKLAWTVHQRFPHLAPVCGR